MYYFSGNCSPRDIGIARLCQTQGLFRVCSVQLFGAWSLPNTTVYSWFTECALVLTLETYDNPENGNYINYITYICYVYYTYETD